MKGGSWGPSKGDFGKGDFGGGMGRSAPYPPVDDVMGDCPLNEDGLPLRPDKEACLYYLNTGTCRSGTHCIFHHPPKAERESELNKSLSKAGMMQLPPGGVLPPIDPDMDMPPSDSVAPPPVVVPPPSEPFAGASGTMSSQMAGIMEKLEALQQSNDGTGEDKKDDSQPPLPSEGGPPVDGKDGPSNGPKEVKPPEAPKEIEYNEDGLPIRPGVQKCIQYLRSGRCTERNCRWDHPVGMGGVMNSAAFTSMPGMIGGLMTEGALAMRPGRDQCPFLAKTNTCPFGPECRFDHSGKDSGSNPESLSKPSAATAPKKKDRGLGGTRGKRPPPRKY